jgi:hypothetical protein
VVAFRELVSFVCDLFQEVPIRQGKDGYVVIGLRTKHQHYVELQLTNEQVLVLAIKARDQLRLSERLSEKGLNDAINRAIPFYRTREGDWSIQINGLRDAIAKAEGR